MTYRLYKDEFSSEFVYQLENDRIEGLMATDESSEKVLVISGDVETLEKLGGIMFVNDEQKIKKVFPSYVTKEESDNYQKQIMISERHIKAWEKFNEDVEAFRAETEEESAMLYEDAYTTRVVKDFKMTKSGILTWVEDGKAEKERMMDEDDAKEWLSFWRANLRRAKRYWSMEGETLDAIQDGLLEDKED